MTDLDTAKITDEDSGYTYEPWQGPNREMGYKITTPAGEVSYFFLNPSGGSDDQVPTVFVYHDNTPGTYDNPLNYYPLAQELAD